MEQESIANTFLMTKTHDKVMSVYPATEITEFDVQYCMVPLFIPKGPFIASRNINIPQPLKDILR